MENFNLRMSNTTNVIKMLEVSELVNSLFDVDAEYQVLVEEDILTTTKKIF